MATRHVLPRAAPAQARSRATVALILETALKLLEEVGAERFNTNLLAERAGVSVRAIYRYFPNKIAVLVALAERVGEWERIWIGDLSRPRPDGDWRAAIHDAVSNYHEAAAERRGVVALRAAMQIIPELRAVEEQASRRHQADLALGLATLGVDLPADRLSAVSETVIETASRLLDVTLFSPAPRAELILDELTRLLCSYLADYIPGRDPPG